MSCHPPVDTFLTVSPSPAATATPTSASVSGARWIRWKHVPALLNVNHMTWCEPPLCCFRALPCGCPPSRPFCQASHTNYRVRGPPVRSLKTPIITTVDLWPITGRHHQLRKCVHSAPGHFFTQQGGQFLTTMDHAKFLCVSCVCLCFWSPPSTLFPVWTLFRARFRFW